MVSINSLLKLVICFCKKEKETTKITSKYYTLCFLMSPRYYENFSQLDIMIIISILRSQLDSFFSLDPIFNGYDVIFLVGMKRIGSFNIKNSQPIYIHSSGGGSEVPTLIIPDLLKYILGSDGGSEPSTLISPNIDKCIPRLDDGGPRVHSPKYTHIKTV